MEGGGRLPDGGWWGVPVSQQGLVGRTYPRPRPRIPPGPPFWISGALVPPSWHRCAVPICRESGEPQFVADKIELLLGQLCPNSTLG